MSTFMSYATEHCTIEFIFLFVYKQCRIYNQYFFVAGEGAIIGDNNFITIDGRIFSLTPSCLHILLTDAKHQSFTLLSDQQDARTGTNYTLLLQNTTVNIYSNMTVCTDMIIALNSV